ncbi:MAG: DegT/DnrJ/EryC1/StrS family aminotransferase [Cyanobacteria bacterium P01_F01_bin.150]
MNVANNTIPFVDLDFQHQPIAQDLKRAFSNVVEQGDFVLGEAVESFERAFALACGVSCGVGVGCGTDAIALGLQSMGVKAGDEVILPTNTFVATLIGVIRTGATPILVDCDPNTGLIDLNAAEQAISDRTQVLIAVHLYGQMVSPTKLLNLASTYDIAIFEDAAQAHLAERDGYRAGTVGIAAAFSFYPSKNLGAFGDGGMLVTNDETIAATTRALRNYGAPRKYYHTKLGTNSRLDSVQAAVLMAKLPHLDAWNSDRRRIAQQYDQLLAPLKDHGICPLRNDSANGHVYHLYVVAIADTCRLDRDVLHEHLGNHGVHSGIHYPLPCHLQPAFLSLGYKEGNLPNAERLCQSILSLPMYPGLTNKQIQYVADILHSALHPSASEITMPHPLLAG